MTVDVYGPIPAALTAAAWAVFFFPGTLKTTTPREATNETSATLVSTRCAQWQLLGEREARFTSVAPVERVVVVLDQPVGVPALEPS